MYRRQEMTVNSQEIKDAIHCGSQSELAVALQIVFVDQTQHRMSLVFELSHPSIDGITLPATMEQPFGKEAHVVNVKRPMMINRFIRAIMPSESCGIITFC
jgi:hypothetical protein